MTVKLTLNNAVATTGTVTVEIDGGDFELTASNPLRVNGPFTLNSISFSKQRVGLRLTSGSTFTGSIEIPVYAKADGMPKIRIDNVSGDTVYLEWPTKDGQTQQELTPGTAMSMADFVPDTSPAPAKA